MTPRKLPILPSGATNAEELAWLRTVAATLPATSYLAQLFSADLVAWVDEHLAAGEAPDLMALYNLRGAELKAARAEADNELLAATLRDLASTTTALREAEAKLTVTMAQRDQLDETLRGQRTMTATFSERNDSLREQLAISGELARNLEARAVRAEYAATSARDHVEALVGDLAHVNAALETMGAQLNEAQQDAALAHTNAAEVQRLKAVIYDLEHAAGRLP